MQGRPIRVIECVPAYEPVLRYANKLETILSSYGINCSIQVVEEVFEHNRWNPGKYQQFKRLFQTAKQEVLVFIPCTTEFFLKEPDFTLLYSGYRSWCDPDHIKVIPFLWSPHAKPDHLETVLWQKKPKLKLGFMGNTFTLSKVTSLGAYLPAHIHRFLRQGHHLKQNFMEFAIQNPLVNFLFFRFTLMLSAVARRKAIQHLSKLSMDVDLVHRDFWDSNPQNKLAYRNHLLSNTYILCPRGNENFSYRFYETLAHGRVPVLIDTDMVLPEGVVWDDLCVRLPYEELERLEEVIQEDYYGKTEEAFIQRQQLALSTMEELRREDWLYSIADDIARVALASSQWCQSGDRSSG